MGKDNGGASAPLDRRRNVDEHKMIGHEYDDEPVPVDRDTGDTAWRFPGTDLDTGDTAWHPPKKRAKDSDEYLIENKRIIWNTHTGNRLEVGPSIEDSNSIEIQSFGPKGQAGGKIMFTRELKDVIMKAIQEA